MKLLPSNQRDNEFGLFGLLANRPLYENSTEAGHMIPDDAVTSAERKGMEEYEAEIKVFQQSIALYNKRYGDDVKNKERDSVYEDIKLDPNNLPATKKQIEDLIKELKIKKGEKWKPSDPQNEILNQLKLKIEKIGTLPQKGRESVEVAHRGRLQQRHEILTQAGERRELWEKKPAYKELNSVFDSLASTEAFRGVWQTPEGLSTQKQREAKELFFAIMAEQTNGFKDDFVLSASFGPDAEENIRNFPFIYNEFLKREGIAMKDAVSLDKIAAAESAVNSARANLPARPVEDIISSNQTGGIAPSELPAEPSIPDSNGWQKRQSLLIDMAFRLGQSAKNTPNSPSKSGWEQAAAELRVYAAHAEACLYLSHLKDREALVKAKFKRNELSSRTRRKMVMELAMRQFGKAMEMVDKGPYGNSDWQHGLHPTVRRMLIASIYESGVASYKEDETGKVTYQENIKAENVWMMSALSLSDYFNSKEVGENMDADHEALLKAAFVGSRIAVLVEDSKPTEDVLAAWITVGKKFGDKGPVTAQDKKFVEEQMSRFSPELRARFAKYSLPDLEKTYQEVQENRKRLQEYLDRAKAAIAQPYSEDSKKFIADIKRGIYAIKLPDAVSYLGKIAVIDGASLDGYIRSMGNLQINFKTAELQDKNMLMFFEGLGINIEGVYPAYLEAIKKDPSLKAEYWDYLLLGSDAEFKKLITLFQTIIPDSIAGGKGDFIAGLQSLRKRYKGQKTLTEVQSSLQEGSADAVILNVFRMLKIHLTGRAETFAGSDRQQKDIEARLNGLHVGDKVTKYVSGVWEMLTGPGQSMANRAAGLVLMYGFYKSARMAMKGEGKVGKALRALFVAGAVEIAAKEITGRGILDRAGLDSIAGAMEGTYEGVLVQDGRERMDDKDITTEAHAAALMELNDVPFDQVMAWYESSDKNGMPRTKGAKDSFPRQINLNRIGPKITWDVKDKKLEARRVVYETVRHFFGYVGDKDNHKDDVQGREALKERWIAMVNDPNYKPKYSSYDHREWLRAGGVKKSDITWQMVMRAEIDPREVDLTHGKTPMGQLEAGARELYTELSEWTRQYVVNPGAGYAEIFMQELGEKAQDAQAFFAEVYKTTERKIYFTKEKAVFWYKEHEFEIRRVAENHWQLLATGLKMPFKLVGAVDDWAIPWTVAKLQQIEESLSTVKEVQTNEDLKVTDIGTGMETLDSPEVKINPHFAHYGIYQRNFLYALRDPNTDMSADRPKGRKYYENPGEHVGYYISEMTEAEAGINPNDPRYSGHPDMANSEMVKKSREQAIQRYINAGMKRAEVEKYMYEIHRVVKTTAPKKMYIFWRMPLRDSAELHLMETGHWADYMDPNKRREREAFTVDPEKTKWENLQKALSLDLGPTRTIVSKVAGYAAQVPRFIFWNLGVAGGVVKTIGNLFYTKKNKKEMEEFNKAVDAVSTRPDAQKQMIDELFTSAESPHQALSTFYKDPVNSKLYKFSLDYAQRRQKPLYLGVMQGRPGYEGTQYLENNDPAGTAADMQRFYTQEWTATHGKKPDPDIEKAISALANPAATPARPGVTPRPAAGRP